MPCSFHRLRFLRIRSIGIPHYNDPCGSDNRKRWCISSLRFQVSSNAWSLQFGSMECCGSSLPQLPCALSNPRRPVQLLARRRCRKHVGEPAAARHQLHPEEFHCQVRSAALHFCRFPVGNWNEGRFRVELTTRWELIVCRKLGKG